MIATVTRRTLVAGLVAGGVTAAVAAPNDVIGGIERRYGGRLGVFVLDTGDGRSLAHRADERFPLQSTFKGMLAAMVLDRVAKGRDRLEDTLPYGPGDLVAVLPVTEPAVGIGRMTINRLCAAILERGDNTAANLLLRHVGGPAALTAYLRDLGDGVTRIDRYEPVGGRDGARDTSTPRTIAGTARTLLLGTALPVPERTRLEGWMAGNVAGRMRLRAAFPKGMGRLRPYRNRGRDLQRLRPGPPARAESAGDGRVLRRAGNGAGAAGGDAAKSRGGGGDLGRIRGVRTWW